MKKLITILSIALLSIALAAPAMAFGPSANADASAGATANSQTINDNSDNSVYNGAKNLRYWSPAGELNYPAAPNMFGGATPSYMDRLKVKDILEYDEDGITLNEALQMRQDDAFMGKRIMVREKFGKLVKDQRIPADQPIAVYFDHRDDMQSLGTITVVSDDKKSITPDVFAEVVIRAHELGGEAIQVKAEGFQRLMRNEGAGIGFTWTGSYINGPQNGATTGVMGAGHSWGQAGYFDHPFIVVHVLAPKTTIFKVNGGDTSEFMILLKE